jgi:hypothetical protein
MDWGLGNGDWGLGTGEWGMGTGDWGMGNGEWGLGTCDWGQQKFHHQQSLITTNPLSRYAFKVHALKHDRLEACPTLGGLNA